MPLSLFFFFLFVCFFRWQGYYFHTDNPYKDLPNAFDEGLKKSREGDLPNAVLLLEAAVLQDPHDSEVNSFNPHNHTYTHVVFFQANCDICIYSRVCNFKRDGGIFTAQMVRLQSCTGRPNWRSWGVSANLRLNPMPVTRVERSWKGKMPHWLQAVWSRFRLHPRARCWLPVDSFFLLTELFTVEKMLNLLILLMRISICPVIWIIAHLAGFPSFLYAVSKEVTSLQAERAKPPYKALSESPGIYKNVPVIPKRGLSHSVWN